VKPPNERCLDCKFYFDNGNIFGEECLRFPPTVIVLKNGGLDNVFPFVDADNWCGEFKPDDTEQRENAVPLAAGNDRE
jgi:hypothetical protein